MKPPQQWTGPEITDGFGGFWNKCDRPNCGLEIVRPGKVQCECDSECTWCDGHITYHLEPTERWPQVSGWFCDNCGPWGPEDVFTEHQNGQPQENVEAKSTKE